MRGRDGAGGREGVMPAQSNLRAQSRWRRDVADMRTSAAVDEHSVMQLAGCRATAFRPTWWHAAAAGPALAVRPVAMAYVKVMAAVRNTRYPGHSTSQRSADQISIAQRSSYQQSNSRILVILRLGYASHVQALLPALQICRCNP